MIDKLNKIRKRKNDISIKKVIINTLLVLLLGIILGIISKALDNMEINNNIWWQNILSKLDLRNILSKFGIWFMIGIIICSLSKSPLRAGIYVFSFFLGMTISYHLYTIIYSGFNPHSYMLKWYIITILSPAIAYIVWYAKGEHYISIVISSIIIGFMMCECFSVGIWYFGIKSIIELIIFIVSLIFLYTKPRNFISSLVIGFILSFLLMQINLVNNFLTL